MSIYEKKFDAIKTLAKRHKIPKEKISTFGDLLEHEAIQDALMITLLVMEMESRLIDPQGRNSAQAARFAFNTLADDSLDLSPSIISQMPEGFLDTVQKLINDNDDPDQSRQSALLYTVLNHFSDTHEWPTKVEARELAMEMYPELFESRLKISDSLRSKFPDSETKQVKDIFSKLWPQLCLSWLPNGKSGRPKGKKEGPKK